MLVCGIVSDIVEFDTLQKEWVAVDVVTNQLVALHWEIILIVRRNYVKTLLKEHATITVISCLHVYIIIASFLGRFSLIEQMVKNTAWY